jgi:hypothetical protein
MAKPNARPDGMAIGISGRPTPETSSRWVGQGRLRRILFNSLNRLRKKLFIDHIYFIIFYPPLPTRPPQNDQMQPPLRSPTVASRILSLSRRARVFLVGCCIFLTRREPSKATTSFIFDFFSPSIRRPVPGDNTPPHVPP